MKRVFLFISVVFLIGCAFEEPVEFPEEVLKEETVALNGDPGSLGSVIDDFKGKSVLVDVWASWCRDCIQGFPDIIALQAEFPEVEFVFLSVDRNQVAWRKGVKKYGLKGHHYYLPSGWNGLFGDFVRLNYIPRYMVLDPNGEISLFKATRSNDGRIKNAINEK